MSVLRRPSAHFSKWSDTQAIKFIRNCVRSDNPSHFIIQDPHAYQRMEERQFDLIEVHNIILTGTCTRTEAHSLKHADRRFTFTLETRAFGKRNAVVAIDDELPGCLLITVF